MHDTFRDNIPSLSVQRRVVGQLMNNELEMMEMEVVEAYFEVPLPRL
jgi:hypothetical protein